MNISGREICHDCEPYVVAEISANHDGSFDKLVALIDAAKDAGADAVKVQCFEPERLAERRGGRDKVITETLWSGRTLLDLYQQAHTPLEFILYALARRDITAFASVFDAEDVDLLEAPNVNCPAYKIASREAADANLVARAASTGKPLIISTGTATEDELCHSVGNARMGTNQIALLYCVSEYPTRMESLDFEEIRWLRYRFGVPIGFSDHTVGIEAAVEAVRAGACIIEKHITLSRADGGLDAAFSLEPHELVQMVQEVRNAAEAREKQ